MTLSPRGGVWVNPSTLFQPKFTRSLKGDIVIYFYRFFLLGLPSERTFQCHSWSSSHKGSTWGSSETFCKSIYNLHQNGQFSSQDVQWHSSESSVMWYQYKFLPSLFPKIHFNLRWIYFKYNICDWILDSSMYAFRDNPTYRLKDWRIVRKTDFTQPLWNTEEKENVR